MKITRFTSFIWLSPREKFNFPELKIMQWKIFSERQTHLLFGQADLPSEKYRVAFARRKNEKQRYMHLVECKKGSTSDVENVPLSLSYIIQKAMRCIDIYIYIDLYFSIHGFIVNGRDGDIRLHFRLSHMQFRHFDVTRRGKSSDRVPLIKRLWNPLKFRPPYVYHPPRARSINHASPCAY